MPLKTAIKWFHRALTAILLIIVMGFVMFNSGGNNRAKDKLVSAQQISDSTWLYVTEDSAGGATVADSYRGSWKVMHPPVFQNRLHSWLLRVVLRM